MIGVQSLPSPGQAALNPIVLSALPACIHSSFLPPNLSFYQIQRFLLSLLTTFSSNPILPSLSQPFVLSNPTFFPFLPSFPPLISHLVLFHNLSFYQIRQFFLSFHLSHLYSHLMLPSLLTFLSNPTFFPFCASFPPYINHLVLFHNLSFNQIRHFLLFLYFC